MKKAFLVLVSCGMLGLGLAACGGDDDEGGGGNGSTTPAADGGGGGAATTPAGGGGGGQGGGGQVLKLSAPASGEFAYDKDKLSAKSGPVTIDFDNPAALSHDVIVETKDGREIARTDLIAESKSSLSANLKPGTYAYYCDVPGHREGGMEGTLTVK